MAEEGDGPDVNTVSVPPMNMYASFTLPTDNTLPGICSHQKIRQRSTEVSYQEWNDYKEHHPSQAKKLNFDRVHWETEALINGTLQGHKGDPDGLDPRYRCPEHPLESAWWWVDRCAGCRRVHNARLRHVKRLRPSLSEPLLGIHEAGDTLHAHKGSFVANDSQRRAARRAARKADATATKRASYHAEQSRRNAADALLLAQPDHDALSVLTKRYK